MPSAFVLFVHFVSSLRVSELMSPFYPFSIFPQLSLTRLPLVMARLAGLWQVYGTITHKHVMGGPPRPLPLNDPLVDQVIEVTCSRSSRTSDKCLVLHGRNVLSDLQRLQAYGLPIIDPAAVAEVRTCSGVN
jgi:hypothetical protein